MPKDCYVAVKGIVFVGDKCLVLKNKNKHWDLPGGRVNDDESLTEALERELAEELPSLCGYGAPTLVDAYRLSINIADDKGLVFLFYKINAEAFVVQYEEEHEGCEWVAKRDLQTLMSGEYAIEPNYYKAIEKSFE